jgi:hypothetical protein
MIGKVSATVMLAGLAWFGTSGAALSDSPSDAEQAFRVPATITFTPAGVAVVPTLDTWTQGTSPTGAACCINDYYGANGRRFVTTSKDHVPGAFRIGASAYDESCGFHVDSYDVNDVYVGSVFSEAPTFCLYAFPVQENDIGVHYRGTWFESSVGTPWGSGAEVTTGARASVTYACGYCRSIEWVATTGPRQGSAKVYIDGALITTVSTYAPSTHYRQAVFHYELPSLDTFSTIKIVNQGTSRHTGLALDAFVVTDED